MNSQNPNIETFSVKTQLPAIKEYWLRLNKEAPHQYFSSWGWIETWLTSLPASYLPDCHIGFINSQPCFGYFSSRSLTKKYKILSYYNLHINTTGNETYDDLIIEYNNFLINTRLIPQDSAIQHIINSLADDKIHIPACDKSTHNALKKTTSTFNITSNKRHSYYIDLSGIRSAHDSYLNTLSKNSRYQIKKSLKILEPEGDLNIQIAETSLQALTMLDELTHIHQRYWIAKNKPGAFSSNYFISFHKKLIENRFDDKEILVTKISTNKSVLGYIYGFLYNGSFLYYQSGFNYPDNKKVKPGYISHYLLIEYFLRGNIKTYDFLAGEQQYKKSLSNSQTEMCWQILLNKNSRILRIESGLKKIKQLLYKKIIKNN